MIATPTTGEVAVRVMRGQTILPDHDAQDTEGYAIKALATVDQLCGEVREEALRQTRVIMENIKRAQGGVGGG